MRRILKSCLPALLLAGCGNSAGHVDGAAAERDAIEQLLATVNSAFEVSDADAFAGGFSEDAVFELNATEPVFGYQRLKYEGRAQIREIISDRVERARAADPGALDYDPASLRRRHR